MAEPPADYSHELRRLEGCIDDLIRAESNEQDDWRQTVVRHVCELRSISAELRRGIEERKRADEDYRKIAALVEDSNDFIGLATLEGDALFVNRAGQAMMGLRDDAHVRATRIYDYVPAHEQSRMRDEILPAVAADGRWDGEMHFRHFETGALIPILAQIFFIREAGTERPLALATISRDISARTRAQDKLRRSEAYLAEGERLSHTGSWAWNATTGDLFWSPELIRIYDLDPITTKPRYPSVMGCIHAEDRARVQGVFEDAVHDQRDCEVAYRVVWRDGSIHHVNNVAHPQFDAAGALVEYVGTTVDTTDRQQTEAALRDSNARLEQILGAITDNFFGLSGDFRFNYFNRHAEELMRKLGKDPAQLIGKQLWEELPDMLNAQSVRRVVTERIAISDELYYAPLDEWVENHMYPSLDGGLVSVQRYITERRRAEEAVQKAQAELARVTRITAMGELAASIAHELNQPLGAIVNNSNTCLRLSGDDRRSPRAWRRAVADIVKDAARASEIIRRIRGLGQQSTDGWAPLHLASVLGGVLALMQPELTKRHLIVESTIPRSLPLVFGDRVQLQQVFLNLIMNAIEAMSGEPETKHRTIGITGRGHRLAEREAVLIMVSDSGPGIKADIAARLFEPFFTTKPQGTGMGLRISRRIIEAHGGQIWLKPDSYAGATFCFALPVADPGAP